MTFEEEIATILHQHAELIMQLAETTASMKNKTAWQVIGDELIAARITIPPHLRGRFDLRQEAWNERQWLRRNR